MLNFKNQYGLEGQIKAEDLGSTAAMLTFKATSGKINDEILDHICNKYDKYLAKHPEVIRTENIAVFAGNYISMDIRQKDVKNMAHFLRHALGFAQYCYIKTWRMKSGLICDVAVLLNGETTDVYVRNTSNVAIPESVRNTLESDYNNYIKRLHGFGKKLITHDIASDRLILEFNSEDFLSAMRKIRRNFAMVTM